MEKSNEHRRNFLKQRTLILYYFNYIYCNFSKSKVVFMNKQISKTKIAFSLKEQFMLLNKKKIDIDELNRSILNYYIDNKDIFFCNNKVNKTIYNILGKNRSEYIERLIKEKHGYYS